MNQQVNQQTTSLKGVMILSFYSLPQSSSKEWSTVSTADRDNLKKQTLEMSEFWWVKSVVFKHIKSKNMVGCHIL